MVRVLSVDPERPQLDVMAEAAAVLARGGLVAFPTETVYGLGARGLRAAEVARIFAAKGRPPTHPLILHVDDELMARELVTSFPELASRLARAFWPGPLTMILPRAAHVPTAVTAGLDTVAIRAPAHPVARALVRAVGEPIAAPSANAHMHVSPTMAAHVVRSLGDAVDLVVDGGPCAHGIESTVLDLSGPTPRVLRPGALGLERLRAVVPDVGYEAITIGTDVGRASPGLASKHYAPRARVVLAGAGTEVAGATGAASATLGSSTRVGALVWSGDAQTALASAASAGRDSVVVSVLPADADGYAAGLFAALYALDEAGVGVIVIERIPDEQAWWAVADRLRRAAQVA